MTKSQKKGPAFLLKTYDMLQKQQFKDIIDWIPDGTGFVVKNSQQLADKVLPKYFKHSNMHSFIRQLNMYGFNKKRGSKIQNYYFHHQFRKGEREMISQMQRKVEKKGIHKQQKKSQANQQISIQLEQSQQNKQNKNQQNRRNNNEIEEIKIRKKIVDLSASNSILLLQQMYHLTSIEQSNLIVYSSLEDDKVNEKRFKLNQILEKFKKFKEQYLMIHCLLNAKLSSRVKAYESQCSKKSEKQLKQTQIEISGQLKYKQELKNQVSKIVNQEQMRNIQLALQNKNEYQEGFQKQISSISDSNQEIKSQC